MTNILFAAGPDRWAVYEAPLRAALDGFGLDYVLSCEAAPKTVDYIVYAPDSEVRDFTPYTRLKAVLNLWAGVERITGNETLTVPLARMVDEEGLTQGMVEYVTGHVLRHHLGMDRYILNPDHRWDPVVPPLASERPVTVLGLGTLGTACAGALAGLGFPVSGWSRTPRELEGITCHHGPDGLKKALAGAEILVLLLPDTPATRDLMNRETLALLPRGACIVNPGRGPLIDDAALVEALDAGQVGHATLDVFRKEPLPQDHPFWSHPGVTITPHVAADTRVPSASRVIAENIRRGEAGEPLLHLVDRAAGY
ncbi:glyoxylate/hydroxypyruvate reductase A [Salipiger thiooxidans]|uniref:2-hydroxyacid dehydrogenase n=1 Tax=Salipiger thiooxidans TaxID=282683 RepID=UPI001A8DB48F|nr:glyoxylate/hydroxypyruvate reductase A [Salipiger thiooxidans]MBN8187052.1 glyoxylate/hydroxypyruvate reductase A [Salipiger thiooxidans]